MIDDQGAVRTAEVDPEARAPLLDRGTEPFFAQLDYSPADAPAQASRQSPPDPTFNACVLGEVKALRFEPVRGGATLRFPIMFNGQTPGAPSDD